MGSLEVTNAKKTTLSQGERAGEPERGSCTTKVLNPSYTLLLDFYGEFGRRPKVDPDSPILDFKVAEFRHFTSGRERAEFLKPIAEDERAAERVQGIKLFERRCGVR